MLATEEHPSSADEPQSRPDSRPSLLETHAHNERMRHIPSTASIVQKLDADLRRRIERLWLPYNDLPASDPRHPAMEVEFRALCRSLDRIGDCARNHHHHRGHNHPPNDLGHRLTWTLNQTIAALNAAEAETFGRRFPFQTFERSNAEPLWAAVLASIQHVQKLQELVREIEPEIDERMYEGLVVLQEPLRREPMA
ncbi:MAG TPA: hypothetical protein VEK57_11520 [Thermoanaerobaculia bacterium]|nr:hypothetical protein [Thermoanaerobaculia bacterium]